MPIRPLESLAFSMHHSRGAYALLIGSGLSHSAGIPTGYEIALDLVRRFAPLRAGTEELSPEGWWQREFGELPSYDALLGHLGKRQEERSAIIRGYIVPSDEERARQVKVPHLGHRIIASLAKAGYVKMIITTNFDPLIEVALEQEGAIPDVISSDDGIRAATHFAHSPCTVLKVNGDYRDVRIRNTAEELRAYGDEMNRYLDSVLDAFGLVVCGWSADYDVALRDAIARVGHRRYTTYWAAREGRLREDARRLVEEIGADLIPIRDADTFFDELWAKLMALGSHSGQHAPAARGPVADAERCIEQRSPVQLQKVVTDEVETTKAVISGTDFPLTLPTGGEIGAVWRERIASYETATRELLSVLRTVAYFDDGSASRLTSLAIERLAEVPLEGGISLFLPLRFYPALRAVYAAGIAALSSGHILHLRAALVDPVTRVEGRRQAVLSRVMASDVLAKDAFDQLGPPGYDRRHTPRSDYLFASLRDVLRPILPSDSRYQDDFDVFEYITALTYLDLNPDETWAPPGAFMWRGESQDSLRAAYALVQTDGQSSPLLASGMFGGDPSRFEAATERLQTFMNRLNWS